MSETDLTAEGFDRAIRAMERQVTLLGAYPPLLLIGRASTARERYEEKLLVNGYIGPVGRP